jgi:hypothetical protein
MTLYEKIMAIYPELQLVDFSFPTGTIRLQNDSDGRGDYIAAWEHPTLARPTALDVQYQRAQEDGRDTTIIISEKQRLRDVTKLADKATTLDELKALSA